MSLGMTVLSSQTQTVQPMPAFSPADIAALNKLRLLMARVKCAAKVDVFKACALLSNDPTTATTAYAVALLRGLRHGLGRAPTLYHPGDADLSTDEVWLLRILLCAQAGDEDSLRFLATRRLTKETLRPIVFLIRHLATRISKL